MHSRIRPATTTWLFALLAVSVLAAACGNDDSSADEARLGGTTTTGATPTTDPPVVTTTPQRGNDVEIDVTPGASTLLDPTCDGESCAYPVAIQGSQFTGSFMGTSVSSGAGSPLPGGGYAAVGIHLFDGEVAGCGTGTLMWTESIWTDDGVHLSGTWTIVESSGTSELVGSSGGGTFESRADATLHAIGTITCEGG